MDENSPDKDKKFRDIQFPAPKKRDPLSPISRSLEGQADTIPPRRRTHFLALALLILSVAAGGAYWATRNFYRSADVPPTADASFLLGGWDTLTDLLKSGGETYSGFQEISAGVVGIMEDIGQAERVLPEFLRGGATTLLSTLGSARAHVSALSDALGRIAAIQPDIKEGLPFFGDYLTFQRELLRGQDLLTGLIGILGSPDPRHVIVIFSNTSELRPGGGFIGSFADLTFRDGTLVEIAVHDINDVDRARDVNVVPPRPLQAITGRWRTADANWFFDYPSSAEKVLSFMQESGLYATATLDALVTVTPRVIQDVLEATGPVRLADGTEIGSDNVVDEVQREVQAGQAAGTAEPKAVLKELVPVLIGRLASLSAEERRQLAANAKDWTDHKDLLAFSRDEHLAKFLAAYFMDGALFPLGEQFKGDYLAVVNANIGGGKSDRHISQDIVLDAHLDNEGVWHDELKVMRTHRGDRAKEWWYNSTNWNYFQVFTPSGATVDAFAGGGERFITSKSDYGSGFRKDPDVVAEEGALIVSKDGKLQVSKQSGRNVFATWQKIEPGGRKDITLTYSRPLEHAPAAGERYQFVFERQSGAVTSFHASFTAPVGFVWAETGSPIFKYDSDDPPGRVVLDLSLLVSP